MKISEHFIINLEHILLNIILILNKNVHLKINTNAVIFSSNLYSLIRLSVIATFNGFIGWPDA